MLKGTHKAVLRRCSPEAVASAMVRVRRHLVNGRWLANNNKYGRNTVRKVQEDLKSGSADEGQLKQYIAASALPHCTDGWSFLGRALNALQNGHAGAALHFAYYAELRAAMSFLATRGIGIFDKKNCVVVNPRTKAGQPPAPSCLSVPGSTHQITWAALEYWGSIATFGSADFLLGLVSPAGLPMLDWLSEYGTAVPSHLGRKWLKDWGLDLKQFGEDRNLRNQVSYRPGDLHNPPSLPAATASLFLIDFWHLFEPSAARFDGIDRHILRNSLELDFQGRTGRKAQGDAVYRQEVDRMVDALRPPGVKKDWLDFLTRITQSETPRLLTLAATKSDLLTPEHHLQVVSRAALLLRLATGACEALRRDVLVDRQDLRFWWNSFGMRRGLWSAIDEPQNCSDLWSDIDLALQEERNWYAANSAANPSYSQWRTERASDFLVMGQCERISLWGLGL